MLLVVSYGEELKAWRPSDPRIFSSLAHGRLGDTHEAE